MARSEPPPQVRDTVRRCLDTVARLGEDRLTRWIVLLEGGTGRDSKVSMMSIGP